MGAIAEALAAFAQPLLEQTDGSQEQLNEAFAMSQLCYNLALLPEADREKTLSEMRRSSGMNDTEFDEFRRELVMPMIWRHEEMFPFLHGRVSPDHSQDDFWPRPQPIVAERAQKYPVSDRYAPCPCNSGRKYKFCCGAKGR
jgi:uncharacterized protein YecA (UPF0149 family)